MVCRIAQGRSCRVYDAATPMEYCLQDVPRSAVEVSSSTRRMQTRMQARVKRALEPDAESGSTEGVVGARGQHKRARLSEEVDQDSTDGEPTEEELPARSRRKRIRGSNAVNGSADGEARTRSQHKRARAVETEEESEVDEVLPRSRGNKRTRRSAEHRGVVDPTDSGQTRSTAGPSRRYNLRPRR